MSNPTPASSERYARNIPQTFECRPTIPGMPSNVLPDELMVDWGGLPSGARAAIYLPAVHAESILSMARKLYYGSRFALLDPHTVECAASGLTYMPIPPGPVPGPCYAGLITIALPAGLPIGSSYRVTVRQLTTAPASVSAVRNRPERRPSVRKALGAFQINVAVQPAGPLLAPEERNLALFRWVLARLRKENRWIPVLQRYLDVLANRVDTLGGNAALIKPSPTGAL